MKRSNYSDIFQSTSILKVLSFLVENPGKELLSSEIQKATTLSKVGVYIALQELEKQGMINREQRGKFFLYKLDYNNFIVKQFKVLRNMLALKKIITKLKLIAVKIILYGSAGRGEDTWGSDFDLLIITRNPEEVKKQISMLKIERKIQAIIKTPIQFYEMKESEKVFYSEVDRGIII